MNAKIPQCPCCAISYDNDSHKPKIMLCCGKNYCEKCLFDASISLHQTSILTNNSSKSLITDTSPASAEQHTTAQISFKNYGQTSLYWNASIH